MITRKCTFGICPSYLTESVIPLNYTKDKQGAIKVVVSLCYICLHADLEWALHLVWLYYDLLLVIWVLSVWWPRWLGVLSCLCCIVYSSVLWHATSRLWSRLPSVESTKLATDFPSSVHTPTALASRLETLLHEEFVLVLGVYSCLYHYMASLCHVIVAARCSD